MSSSIPMLQPVAALLLLNCVMLVWLYLVRLPAISKVGLKLDANAPRGEQMSQLPPRVRWKADNYNHLLEQPILFYAVCFLLIFADAGDGLNLQLAWIYVGLRILHSLYQALWNVIPVRFVLFALSSIVLIVLVVRAAVVVF